MKMLVAKKVNKCFNANITTDSFNNVAQLIFLRIILNIAIAGNSTMAAINTAIPI